MMAKTFKILSALLSYPTRELQDAADGLRDMLRDEALFPDSTQTGLEKLIGEFAASDLYVPAARGSLRARVVEDAEGSAFCANSRPARGVCGAGSRRAPR